MYEKIMNDPDYIKMIDKIESFHFITNDKWDWEHGLGHMNRVSLCIVRILTELSCDEATIEMGAAAGLLHDIGLVTGKKEGHDLKSAELANEYLRRFPLTDQQKRIIVQAIEDHSKGDNIESMVGAALFLADKLDLNYHRVEHSIICDTMNREIKKIRNVDLQIYDDILEISYETMRPFDSSVLKGWSKCLTGPVKAAHYFGRKCSFMCNGMPLDLGRIL